MGLPAPDRGGVGEGVILAEGCTGICEGEAEIMHCEFNYLRDLREVLSDNEENTDNSKLQLSVLSD